MTAEPTPAPRGQFVRWAVPVVSCLALATLAAHTRPFGWAATALVAAPSILLLAHALRRPDEPLPADPRLRNGLLLWSPLALAISVWELFALSRQSSWRVPDPSHPTLSTLLDTTLEQGPGRWAGWLLWLAIGWWLLR
ncbi:hypothetical protein ACIBEK_24915 [Nocardia fusca]|uniref:hypothetical protein n=1 Tax=Nocardia fusca TaxID=941183 RepID=UPI0037B4033F